MRRLPAAMIAGLVFLGTAKSFALAEPVNHPVNDEQQSVSTAIARALAQRGMPYVYGGGNAQGPTGNPNGTGVVGFDASGLMVYAFAGAGVKLPRTSTDQYNKAGRSVWPQQAQPGDLIFYGPNGTESVAMYLGNGQMLEATNPVVTISPVRSEGMAPYMIRVIG